MLVSRLWEERRLAYAIKGQRKGAYWLTYFRLDGERLAELQRQCQITDDVLRVLFLKVDPRIVDTLVAHALSVPTAAPVAAAGGDAGQGPRRRSRVDVVAEVEAGASHPGKSKRRSRGSAMASYNRVILLGNLTRDPEIRYLASGMAVCDVGLAVNDRRKNASGEWVDETTFVDVTVWGRTAEVMGEYLSKGSPVLIEGRLKLDSWEGQDGQKTIEAEGRLRADADGRSAAAKAAQARRRARGRALPLDRPRRTTPISQAAPPEEVYDAPPADDSGGDDIPF